MVRGERLDLLDKSFPEAWSGASVARGQLFRFEISLLDDFIQNMLNVPLCLGDAFSAPPSSKPSLLATEAEARAAAY